MEQLKNHNPIRLSRNFFNTDAQEVAKKLLGKVIQVKQGQIWLMVRIIETEAYYKKEKASHASLGYTARKQALFAAPGTIYMYYARGGDSLNFSCQGEGNAVLIKSAFPIRPQSANDGSIEQMKKNNPQRAGTPRKLRQLCAGQTLLCKSLGLKVPDWNNKQLSPDEFRLVDDGYTVSKIIRTMRLGIRPDRDAQLPYRFIDFQYAPFCTKNPLTVRNWRMDREYSILEP
jgi:DNA-3-methyladenine glycosylase